MQKKFLLLAVIVCFSSQILNCSSGKQPYMKIGEAFIALLKDESNKGKSIKQLEAEIFDRSAKLCTLDDVTRYLKDFTDDEFLNLKMPKSISQQHAIFKVQMLMKVCNDIAKSKGIKVEEEYGDNFKMYVACVERMNK